MASALRARGERMTKPRRVVVRALAGLPGHPSSEDVVAAVARLDPTVHRASVYRALDVLRGLGVLAHVHLGHGGTVHHLAREPEAHGHGQCHRCGTLVDLPLRPLLTAGTALSDETGFDVDPGHVALSGTCRTCRSAP